METIDWKKLREDFPALDQQVHGQPLIYLDNAASSQKPESVLGALLQYYECDNANVHRGIHELSNRATARFEGGRARTAQFLNAASENEIIFTRGTTEAINLIATSWGNANLKEGDTILLSEMEHHSNIVPWQLLTERTGAKLKYIPVTGDIGLLDLDSIDGLLTEDVKLLTLTHISNSLGTINPVKEICRKARDRGVVTVIDAAQSAGHRPLDVQEIGCDFLALSGHKMCAPMGIGVLYGRLEILKKMPPYHGGGEMILDVDFHRSTWKQPPHKFEAGTPNVGGVVGLHAAMDYLDKIGRDQIALHDQELGAHAFEKLSKIDGIRIFGPHIGRAGLISFLLDDVHAHDLVTVADQRGLALRGGHHCNQPLMKKLGVASTARASFYLYNTTDEIDRFVEILKEIQQFFAG